MGWICEAVKQDTCPPPGLEVNTELRMLLELKSTEQPREDSGGVTMTHQALAYALAPAA